MAQRTKELPSDLIAALEISFRETFELLVKIAKEEGLDVDAIVPPPPVAAERAKRIMAILDPVDPSSIEALVVRMKIARLEDRLDDPEADGIYRFDTVPNLLLLERLIEALHPLTAAALREELAPLFDAIESPFRRAMEMLVETGLAPSPFCIDDIRAGDSRHSRA